MANRPVSIIVPNHNHLRTLKACITSIFDTTKNDPDWELVVVDDGSTDGSLDYLKKLKGIHLIQQERKGTTAAINAGIAASGENDIVRIHADVILETPGWLGFFREAIDSNPKAGVIGAKILRPDDTIQAIGRNIITGLGIRDWHANLQMNQLDSPKYKTLQEVDSVPGALTYYRRECIESVGSLDEHYFPAWIEDDDFCLSARYNNYKVYVQPLIKAVHYGPVKPDISRTYLFDQEYQFNRTYAIKQESINHHFDYWKKKWGWDPLYPDLSEIRRLYGNTEICWRIGEPMHFNPTDWPPAVDACMVTWNNLSTLKSCLDALSTTDYPKDKLHFYIVNNGSTDGTHAYLEQLANDYPFSLKCVHLESNVGAAPGLNTAFIQGGSEMIAKLDDDIFPPADWLKRLVENFRKRPYAGVVGGKAIYETSLQDIQCGAVNFWPQYFNHMHEIDDGQAAYLARVSHVQGACCLYRRQTMKDCGYLDIRFNPSQWDDVEHHLRLYTTGYEVIYDGEMSFVHKFGFNAAGTGTKAKLSNSAANEYKLKGKWGEDIYQIIDYSIDTSREGRYLPANGDTSALTAQAPKPDEFPRRIGISSDHQTRIQAINSYEQQQIQPAINDQNLLILDLVAKGLQFIDDRIDGCIEIYQQTLNLFPYSPEAIIGLATAYAAYGITDRLDLYLRRAQSLLSTDSTLYTDIRSFKHQKSDNTGLQQSTSLISLLKPHLAVVNGKSIQVSSQLEKRAQTNIKSSSAKSSALKVLFLTKYSRDVYRTMNIQLLEETAVNLERSGIEVKVSADPNPDPAGFDLVHVWGISKPDETFRQVKGIRVKAPHIPLVLSPNYTNFLEADWVKQQLPMIFLQATSEEHLYGMLGQLERNELTANGHRRTDKYDPLFPGYMDFQREIINLCDYLMPQSEAEAFVVENVLGIKKPASIWQYAVDPHLFDNISSKPFINEFGLSDFVLITDPVGWAHNQAMILTALGGSSKPVVLVGKVVEQNDMRIMRRIIGPNIHHFQNLPLDLSLSAFKAARIHIAPAWMGTPQNSLIAALAGLPVILSDRIYGAEYFENYAYYFDPSNLKSIKAAIGEALDSTGTNESQRDEIQSHIRKNYSWEQSVHQLLGGYAQTLAMKNKSLPKKLATNASISQSVLSPSKTVKKVIDTKPSQKKTYEIKPESTQPVVDIVVPIYGQVNLLRKCVESVLETTTQTRLILVDDCTPGNEIQEYFKEIGNHPGITTAKTPRNMGFIGTCKHGAVLGSAPFILFLNSDTEAIENGWLDKMLPETDDIGIVGARLLYPPSIPGFLAGKIQHAGVARNSKGIPYHPFLGWDANSPEVSKARDVNAVTGACLLVRRSLWNELGGWDERFGKGVYEDVDLGWRTKKKGLRVLYQPAATLYHHESASKSPDGNHQLNEHTQENLEQLLKKWNYPGSDEDLFFNADTVKRWEKANTALKPLIEKLTGNSISIQSAKTQLEKILEFAPDHVETLFVHARILSQSGDHRNASKSLKQVLRQSPTFWDARLFLIDEYLQSGEKSAARQEYMNMKMIFADHPEIQKRSKLFEEEPVNEVTASPVNKYDAEETYNLLFEADDITEALLTYRDRLDQEFVNYVSAQIEEAEKSGDTEIAEGLNTLLSFVSQIINEKSAPAAENSAVSPDPEDLFFNIINSEDIISALETNQANFNHDFLNLVMQNAQKAREEGDVELAEGLEDMGLYVQQVLNSRFS